MELPPPPGTGLDILPPPGSGLAQLPPGPAPPGGVPVLLAELLLPNTTLGPGDTLPAVDGALLELDYNYLTASARFQVRGCEEHRLHRPAGPDRLAGCTTVASSVPCRVPGAPALPSSLLDGLNS